MQTTKKLFRRLLAALLLAAAAAASPGPACAESDSVIHVYIYHDYYVPYMPGADDCYGAYRIIGSRGSQYVSELTLARSAKPGALPGAEGVSIPEGTDYVAAYQDARQLFRDDVLVFTSFQVKAGPFEEIEQAGRYVYHHIKSYYFETPYSVVGYTADFSPVAGSAAYSETGRPWLVAADQEKIKLYMPSFEPLMLLPNFPGSAALSRVSYKSWRAGPEGAPEGCWAYISRSAGAASGSGWNSYRRGGRILYILTTNPYNDAVKDHVGWWEPWAIEMLSSVDDARENGEADDRQDYDEPVLDDPDGPAGGGVPAELAAALEWDRPSIYYDESTVNSYLYAAPLKQTAFLEGGLPAFPWAPTLDAVGEAYEDAAGRILDAALAGNDVPMPWTPGSGALDALQSQTAGYWHVPKAGVLENKSMSILTHDPEFLGQAPFHRAQSKLYRLGKKDGAVLAGQTEAEESMSAFLGLRGAPSGDYLAAFRRKVSAAPFKYGAWKVRTSPSGVEYTDEVWTDPYSERAYGGETGGVWRWWARNYRPFYDAISPLCSLGDGYTFFGDAGADWSGSVFRRRLPQVQKHGDTAIETVKSFPVSVQNSVKSRSFKDVPSYTDRAGGVKNNSVQYVSGYKKLGPADYGSVSLSGRDLYSVVSPLAVWYYPARGAALGEAKKTFPFLGAQIKLPDYSAHLALWSAFDKEN